MNQVGFQLLLSQNRFDQHFINGGMLSLQFGKYASSTWDADMISKYL